MSDLSEPIPAATLVLMRERPGGPPELLVMERTGHMVFAAGALVFPGGRIDAADHESATPFSDFEDAAARIAAVRETIEETGLAPAISPAPDPAMVAVAYLEHVGFGSEAANEAFCNSPNLPRNGPWDVDGNVQVRSG